MNVTERKRETTPEFIALAEQAAINKVIDIHKERTLKHGFVRFGPLMIEEGSNESFYNNKAKANPSIDRLRGILLFGLVSEIFAKRAKIPISRNFSDPNNDYGISLTPYNVIDTFDLAVLAATHHRRTSLKIPRENIYVLIISNDVNNGIAPKTIEEAPSKYRIPPRFFKGIVFLDQIIESNPISNPYPNQYVEYESSSELQAADIVSQTVMDTCYNSNLAIPIYGVSGALYWPKRMKYQEVQDSIRERRSNGI